MPGIGCKFKRVILKLAQDVPAGAQGSSRSERRADLEVFDKFIDEERADSQCQSKLSAIVLKKAAGVKEQQGGQGGQRKSTLN